MNSMTSPRSKLVAWLVAAVGFVATVSVANAQDWYYINRQPAPLSLAQAMAARHLPYGYYWLQPNGNWGFEGSSDAVGNIYGHQPSLSERGRLYYPGELLK
jgi:heptaprenylglyceryl phosphate synthase